MVHKYAIKRGSDLIEVECRCSHGDTPDCASNRDVHAQDWLKRVIRPGHSIARNAGVGRVWLNGTPVPQF